MRPFVKELSEPQEMLEPISKKRPERSSIALLVSCLAGLTLQLVTAVYPLFDLEVLYLALSWVLCSRAPKEYYLPSLCRP